MNVGYSVTGNDATDFIWLNGEKPIEVPMGNWTEYKYTIPAEAKYITINCVSNNIFVFMVDDIFIGVELPEGVDLKQHERKYLFRSLFRWRKNQHDPTEQLSVLRPE